MTADLVSAALRACTRRSTEVLTSSRAPMAPTRKLAAYLAVVELELPASRVRRALGWRRTDLDTACLEVEDLREDPQVDEAIEAAATDLRAEFAPHPTPAAPAPLGVEALNAQRSARAARRALSLLVAAGGEIVPYQAFGAACSARVAICAARKALGGGGIRTIRGRGFRITEAGLAILRAQLSRSDDTPDAVDLRCLQSAASEQIAA